MKATIIEEIVAKKKYKVSMKINDDKTLYLEKVNANIFKFDFAIQGYEEDLLTASPSQKLLIEDRINHLKIQMKDSVVKKEKLELLKEEIVAIAFPYKLKKYELKQEVNVILKGHKTDEPVCIVDFEIQKTKIESPVLVENFSWLINYVLNSPGRKYGLKYYKAKITDMYYNIDTAISEYTIYSEDKPGNNFTYENVRTSETKNLFNSYEVGDNVLIEFNHDTQTPIVLGFWQEPKLKYELTNTFFDFKKEKYWGKSPLNLDYILTSTAHIYDYKTDSNVYAGTPENGSSVGLDSNVNKRWLVDYSTPSNPLYTKTFARTSDLGEVYRARFEIKQLVRNNTFVDKNLMEYKRGTYFSSGFSGYIQINGGAKVNNFYQAIQDAVDLWKQETIDEVNDFFSLGNSELNINFDQSFGDIYDYIDEYYSRVYRTTSVWFKVIQENFQYNMSSLSSNLVKGYYNPSLNTVGLPSPSQIQAAQAAEINFNKYDLSKYNVGQIIQKNTFDGQTKAGLVVEYDLDDETVVSSNYYELKHLETIKLEYLNEVEE